jgi:hypothetical protein
MSQRPKLPPVSEQMKHIAAMLEQELLGWPGVSARPMFGMRALYRGPRIFAMLPDKRALENANAIAYKMADSAARREGRKWQLVEVEDERGLNAALACLDKAYRSALR